MSQQAQLTLNRIVSAGDGSDYLALSAPALGQYLIIRRVRTGTTTDFFYFSTEDKAAYIAAAESGPLMAALPYKRRAPFGFDSTFLVQGVGITTAPTAAVPTTSDGAPVYTGGGGGTGGTTTIEDGPMATMSAQRLVSIDNKFHTDEDGRLLVAVDFPQKLAVDVQNGTLDVNVVSEPQLPYNAATADGQAAIEAQLDQLLDALLQLTAGQQTDALTNAELRATPVPVTPSLPAGAATAAKQDLLLTALGNVMSQLAAPLHVTVDSQPAPPAQQHVVVDGTAAVTGPLTDVQLRTTPVPVSVVAPVSVTGTFWQPTQPISAASLPLPAGAATAANQVSEITVLNSLDGKATTGNASLAAIEGKTATSSKQDTGNASLSSIDGKVATTALQTAGNASLASIDAKLTNPLPVSVTFPATQAVSGTFWQATQPVSAASLPLPTGASTAALQTTGNTSLASIDSKLTGPLSVTGTLTATPAAPRTSGGLTSRLVVSSGASTNATVVKASAGQVYTIHASNTATSARYINFYNQTTAPVAANTPVEVYCIPAGQFIRASFDGLGSAYSTGIAFTITSTNGLLGTLTALLVAGEVAVNVHYA